MGVRSSAFRPILPVAIIVPAPFHHLGVSHNPSEYLHKSTDCSTTKLQEERLVTPAAESNSRPIFGMEGKANLNCYQPGNISKENDTSASFHSLLKFH